MLCSGHRFPGKSRITVNTDPQAIVQPRPHLDTPLSSLLQVTSLSLLQIKSPVVFCWRAVIQCFTAMTVWRHLSGNSAHCKCLPPHRWCLQHRKKTRIALIIILTTIAIVFVASNDNRFMCYLEHRKYVWKDGYRLYSRTEDMIVRAVFLDDRPRYRDQSVAVFLVEMRKSMIEMNLTMEYNL